MATSVMTISSALTLNRHLRLTAVTMNIPQPTTKTGEKAAMRIASRLLRDTVNSCGGRWAFPTVSTGAGATA